ncbi:MAG: S41 family peptidase [Candidatus Brocadiaceae bacterium]|jgi:carboxyl-terminal processing protease
MKAKKLCIVLVLGLALTLGFASVRAKPDAAEGLPAELTDTLSWLEHHIEEHYPEEVDRERLLVGAVQGMLSKLDEHSSYMPPEILEVFEADTKGEFGGLGIEIKFEPIMKAVLVKQTIPGTPAFRAGLLAGDLIVQIRQGSSEEVIETADFEHVFDAVTVLRGEPGTRVTLTVLRGKDRARKEITITRDVIRVPDVRAADLMGPEGKIGYVYIRYFQQRTVQDFQEEMDRLQREGAEGLIMDLRFNPGGLLEGALEMADLFLDDKLIVSVEGKEGPTQHLRSRPGEAYPHMPIVMLINNYSASASEIVAAALAEHGRATLVGSPTHGKASVQQIFRMEEVGRKDAVKLTIAHYFTPAGELITGKGVQPDIEVEVSEEDLDKLTTNLDRRTSYPRPQDEEPAADDREEGTEAEEEPFVDPQLARAVEVMTRILAEKTGEPHPTPHAAVAPGTAG